MINTEWRLNLDSLVTVSVDVESRTIQIRETNDWVHIARFEVDGLIEALKAARDQIDEIERQASEATAND